MGTSEYVKYYLMKQTYCEKVVGRDRNSGQHMLTPQNRLYILSEFKDIIFPIQLEGELGSSYPIMKA
jgi:hypothetical protein